MMQMPKLLLFVLVILTLMSCPPHGVKIGIATWKGRNGGVLPNQTGVPAPFPMPQKD